MRNQNEAKPMFECVKYKHSIVYAAHQCYMACVVGFQQSIESSFNERQSSSIHFLLTSVPLDDDIPLDDDRPACGRPGHAPTPSGADFLISARHEGLDSWPARGVSGFKHMTEALGVPSADLISSSPHCSPLDLTSPLVVSCAVDAGMDEPTAG